MKIVFGADHKGIPHRDALVNALRGVGDVHDLVEAEPTLSDYVEVAERVAQQINGDTRGVIICGTGIGISIVANKRKNVSAARCVSVQDAIDSRLINNSNVLCLSAGTPVDLNQQIIQAFFATAFPGDERRTLRLKKITDIEYRNFK